VVLRKVLGQVSKRGLNMRKRSKYRPKHVLLNPMGFVMENLSPVRSHTSFMLDLKIKNHGAMTLLTTGKAKHTDIDVLIQMVNMTEAFARLGFGKDYSDVVRDGLQALRDVAKRGAVSGSFVLKAHEMNAMNTVMELHDAQMDVVTLKDMDAAIALVREEYRLRKMTPILEKNT
jgi:hypothetical protein